MNLFGYDFVINLNLFLTCFTLCLVSWFINFIRRLQRLPSGPWGLPIVGYLPFIENDTYLQFTKLADEYGPLFSFKYGQFDVICLNDWELIKKAFESDDLLARPDQTFVPEVIDAPSLFEMSGDLWKAHRRLGLKTLRNVGLGKTKMENQIKDEIETLVGTIKQHTDQPVNFAKLISVSIANNISILLFGHRFDYNDERVIKIEKAVEDLNRTGHFFNAAASLPWLAKLLVLFNYLSLEKMRQQFETIEGHVISEVESHKQNETTEVRDYIDGFLQEMKSQQNQDESSFNITTLRRNTTVFYTAGSDTVQLVLNWIMLHLVVYPEYQVEIRDEISQKIGLDQSPDSLDRSRMPLTMSFIYEVLRVSSVVPINPFRRATKDIRMDGNLIPKDSLVVFNTWFTHHDPKLWDNPQVFSPHRFLNEDKSKAVKPPYLIPFSGGKRVCPGESFAILQLFLYLVSILQKFTISVEPGKTISLKSQYIFTRRPDDPVELIFRAI